MATITLSCAVYETGEIFYVEIARDAAVDDLQQTIVSSSRGGLKNHFHAADLKLYLARKNGVWLHENDALSELLRGDVDPTTSWLLNDDTCFGAEPDLGKENIHVVVNVSERARKRRRQQDEELTDTKWRRLEYDNVLLKLWQFLRVEYTQPANGQRVVGSATSGCFHSSCRRTIRCSP